MALKNIALSVFLLTSLVVTIYAMPAGTVGEPKAARIPPGGGEAAWNPPGGGDAAWIPPGGGDAARNPPAHQR